MIADEGDVVFNVVWTGAVFEHLRHFVCSLMRHSAGVRFRFVANGCTPGSKDEMRRFAEEHADTVVEVLDVSPDAMVAHGVALDSTYRCRDDGPLFCLVDADIYARAPFVSSFVAALDDHAAVTSGREVWNDDNVVPPGHGGVGGRHFFDENGFVFGSPHLALYRRDALDEAIARWGVGFGSAGPDVPEHTASALRDLGFDYLVYDTGKLVNICLQLDGHRVLHFEHPDLLHIGGLSHYLASPAYLPAAPGSEPEPDWVRYEGMAPRHEVARFTAGLLRALVAGRSNPIPEGLPPEMDAKLRLVHAALTEMLQHPC